MKKFSFSLESVLNLKIDCEEQKLAELGKVSAECSRIQRELNSKIEAKRTASYPGGQFSIQNMAYLDVYRQKLTSDQHKLNDELEFFSEKKERAIANYVEAKKETEIYKKLKEKKYKEYRKEYEKATIRMIDDITGTRSAFKKAE
jgi:flagellar export protein FliJ